MESHADVPDFIRTAFRSVWGLELLCYLRRNRGLTMQREQMVADLRASDLVITKSLDSLLAAGLVVEEEGGSARYAPASDSLDQMAERVEALYARSPDAVRRMIVSASNPGIAAFADAFRLRRD